MSEQPEIVDVEAVQAAVIPLTISPDRMGEVMGPTITELYTALKAQGIAPAGAWFSHYLAMDAETWTFEVGVPVATPVRPAGKVVPGSLPAARVARMLYAGSYEGLHEGWSAFNAWLTENGQTGANDFWEVYLVGPESGGDPSTWRTELYRPLA